ncbi:MAG: HEAT repeat domain-containing protein [Verrucomicrobiae bacterium]|nr:HEAT repeat domain-containing protein [Verrucomicrobiae bacterium]
MSLKRAWAVCGVALGMGWLAASGAEVGTRDAAEAGRVMAASEEGREAMRRFRIPAGWRVDLVAAEPHLANPVAFAFDEDERIYVAETFRHGGGVLDIRGRSGWPSAGYRARLGGEARLDREARQRLSEELLDADLALRTVEDRERMLRGYFLENVPSLERYSDRVKRITRGPDGRATGSTVFADGFRTLVDGIGSGVLARGGEVWYANIPHLWRLRDTDGDGVADERTSLHHGYGVRVGFLGHDLHGLCFGPDGRLYFSIGDRGASVMTREGVRLDVPDTGAVFRCDPDGANLEVFATGLRNPQELAFDAWGNLWTGDNNSDGGDQARWLYVVEGGDYGWHIGWQFIESPNARGPWNSEGMWRPGDAERVGYLIPPLANIGAGPSGLTYGAGTGLPEGWAGRFFMVDFRGGPSGIWSIGVRPKGAGYALTDAEQIIWNALPTDVELGPDGGLYWSDWVEGWGTTGKGRIYRAYDPEVVGRPEVLDTRRWLGAELRGRGSVELLGLLGHADLRVRQRAQFALADRGEVGALRAAAERAGGGWARLHGIWGLGQVGRRQPGVLAVLMPLLGDGEAEVRAQAAKMLGEARHRAAGAALESLLGDPEARPRFFAALALGRMGRVEAGPGVLTMLRANGDADAYLRHAGATALAGILGEDELAALAQDASVAVRRAAVVALRRLASPGLAAFVADGEASVVLEAARAIHDLPVEGALPALAGLLGKEVMEEALERRVLGAALRVGGWEQARALAGHAARGTAVERTRVEALRHLGAFDAPSGRDPVTGLWRPAAWRDADAAREMARRALEERFEALLTAGPEGVQSEAIGASGRLGLRGWEGRLARLAGDVGVGVGARLAALRVLGEWRDESLTGLMPLLLEDGNEAVRAEALRWQARLGLGDPLVPIREILVRGTLRERQAAFGSLAGVRGAAAESLLVEWLNRGAAGELERELILDAIEAGRSRDGAAVREALSRWEARLEGWAPLVLHGGDAGAGRRVFYEKAEVQCVRCHRAGGDGGVVGPDLMGLGASKTREYLLQSITDPNAVVAEGYENVMVETRDGREFAGTVQGETDQTLILNTLEEGRVTLQKAEITGRWKGLSGMPEGLTEMLTLREMRDLIEFMAGLTGEAGAKE